MNFSLAVAHATVKAAASRRTPKGGGSEGEGGGTLDGELVGVGEYVFDLTEAGGAFGEFLPFGTLHGEENFVDIAETVLAAAESGFDFLRDGELQQDLVHGLIEEGIGDGEKAHEEETGAFILKTGGLGNSLAKIGARESGANQLRGFAAA